MSHAIHKNASRGFPALAGIVLVALMVACGDDNQPSGITTPSVTRTTDMFSGTVQVAGSAFHSFRVAQTGTTEVTLTAASPPATVVVGLALGTVDDAGCTRLTGGSVDTAAGATPQLAGITSTGTLCVQIRDVGNQTAPVSYTVSVTHP